MIPGGTREVRRTGRSQRLGSGLCHVGTGEWGSAVEDPTVRHAGSAVAGVEGLVAEPRLPVSGDGEHRTVLGAGVQRIGGGPQEPARAPDRQEGFVCRTPTGS